MDNWQAILQRARQHHDQLEQRVEANDWEGFNTVLASRDQCLAQLQDLPLESLPEAEQRQLASELNSVKRANSALVQRVEREQGTLQREHKGTRLAEKAVKAYKKD